MATIAPCRSAGGRIIGVRTDQAVPLAVSLRYTPDVIQAPLVFGPAEVQAELLTILNQYIPGNTGAGQGGVEDMTKLGIAVGIEASQSVAAQFQNALTDTIYVVPFGDKVGEVRIKFITGRLCDSDAGDAFGAIQHYLDRRILPSKNRAPVLIAMGPAVFRGHLTGLSVGAQSSDFLTQATLIFNAWPQ